MKSLQQFIMESKDLTDIIDKIQSKIANISTYIETDDDNERAYKELLKVNSTLYAIEKDINKQTGYNILDAFLDKKGLSYCNKEISNVLINRGDFENFVYFIKNYNSYKDRITFDNLKSGGNIISIIYEKLNINGFNINKDTLTRLALIRKEKSGSSVGEFEVLISLFIDNAEKPDKGGDIRIDKDFIVEVKNGNGQFTGDGIWTSRLDECDDFNKYCKEKFPNLSGLYTIPLTSNKNGQFRAFIEDINKLNDNDKNEIIDKLFNLYKILYIKHSELNDNDVFIKDFKDNFKNCLLKENDFIKFRKIIMTYMLYIYCYKNLHHKQAFKYLIVTAKIENRQSDNFGDFKLFEMPNGEKTISYTSINNIINDIEKFKGMPYFDGDKRHNITINWTKSNENTNRISK